MRALRTLAWIVAVLSVVASVAQAKTNYAYVANNSAGTVSVINVSNNTVVKTITVGTFPYAVAVDQPGKFAYVTNSGSGTVSVISTSTNTVVATIAVPGAFTVALSPNGKTAYVTTGSPVAVINTGTKKVTATIPVPNPIGLSVTPNGAFLYVVAWPSPKLGPSIYRMATAEFARLAAGRSLPSLELALASTETGSGRC